MGNFRTSKNKDIDVDALSWFKDGLRFECQRCGRCCRGEPGVVWVNKQERGKNIFIFGYYSGSICQELFTEY
jgi:Fe-S-cluster containining protein